MTMVGMTVLSESDREQVHGTALRILSEVGVKIDSSKVLAMVEKAGAVVDRKNGIARFDERMIESALKSAPKKVRICSRGGKDVTIPERGIQLMSTDGEPPAVFDSGTATKRASTLRDLIELTILADALPEVDFFWPPVVATDMPSDRSSFYEFLAAITHTSKHVQHGATSAEEAAFQIEVATAILGSRDALRSRPIFSDVCTPISPLRYDEGESEALVELACAGVPLVHLSMAIAGSVTPVSIAGSLAIINAENLAGLTLTQIANPGAPSIYSSFSGVSDLRTGIFLCGTPEGILMDTAAVEMARHYGLPCCAGGPSNASRSLSAEAGMETALTTMASALAGADMMVGLGGLDRAAMICPEKLVMDCELWRWVKRLRAGITVDDSTLGFDAIKRQGPGGLFLSDPHTLKHMRKELLIPQVTSHHSAGEPDYSIDELIEYARKRTKDILSTHKPPLLDRETAERVGEVAKKYGIVLPDGKQIFPHN